MSRRSTFIAGAESVQGNKDATVTFKAITLDGWEEYRTSTMTDRELLAEHIVAWNGIEDDDGNDLPSPADEPGILGKLYTAEKTALMSLLYTGAPAIPVKN
jgi:hypothetical protein